MRVPISILAVLTVLLGLSQPTVTDDSLDELKTLGSPEKKVDLLADLSYKYAWEDADKAYNFAMQGLRVSDSIGYEYGRGKCLSEAGLSLLYKGYAPEALEYLFDALTILEKYEDDFWVFTTLSSIGYVYWEQNEHYASLEYFKQARPLSDSLDIDNFRISVLSDIGETYIQTDQLDSGLVYIKDAYELALATDDSFQRAVTENQLGIICRETGRPEEGLHYSRRSLEFAHEVGFNARRTYLNIAKSYFDMAMTDSAIYFSRRAIEAARSGSYMDIYLLQAYQIISEVYRDAGFSDSAIFYLDRQIETNAQIVNKEKTKKIQGIVFDRQLNQNRIEQARKEARLEASIQRQRLITYVVLFIVLLALIFSAILINRIRLTNRQKKAIQKEKERGDELLLNILPSQIAEELKTKGRVDAVRFEEAVIMFTDFVSFTSISSSWSAEDLVKEIDICFSKYDEIIYSHGLEKIKTIGDSYMCAGGLPIQGDGYALRTIEAALEIQRFMIERQQELISKGRSTFDVRIGIHCGPVIAGIVGIRKFAYDVWGDTVNIASRMESCGISGRVNISEYTFEKVKEHEGLVFEHRDPIDVKGVGKMTTYLVDSHLR